MTRSSIGISRGSKPKPGLSHQTVCDLLPILNGSHTEVTVTVVINANAATQGWLLNDLRFGS